jgi:hypothetical protein
MKPLPPGTKVVFEYRLSTRGGLQVHGTVLEPSEFTRPGEVRVQWADGYGITNVTRLLVEEVEEVEDDNV